MTSVICCDLDRTLIYSQPATGLPLDEMDSLVCVEIYQNAPLSYVTPLAVDLVRQVQTQAVLVPTTTRTPAQYARIELTAGSPYAICSNGGDLLVDGNADFDWHRQVRQQIVDESAPLLEVQQFLTAKLIGVTGPDGDSPRLRVAEDLFAYAVVDRSSLPESWIDEVSHWCDERNWRTSVQGRKIYCVPNSLTKSAAMHEVQRRTGSTRILAAGDSLLDADMLLAADAGIRPAHGELFSSGWTAPNIEVTQTSGVAAGEEILQWFLSQTLPQDRDI